MSLRHRLRRLRRRLHALPEQTIPRYLPPAWFGYRWVFRESVAGYFQRHQARGRDPGGHYRSIHPEAVFTNPLPRNISARQQLPADRGWWGFSFQDVPARTSQETFLAALPDCQVVGCVDAASDFHLTVLNRDRYALSLREIAFRPGHARLLNQGGAVNRLSRATWIIERVYHNHAHWLTAHLPKLCLLGALDRLEHVVLPTRRTPTMDASLAMLGLSADDFPHFDPTRPLAVDEITLLGTDRFRPELLQPVREALVGGATMPWRRVYISRAQASRRCLENEDEIWPLFHRAGFQKVCMETLDFPRQVALMSETAILAAPHGAGLTNMMFCPAGCEVLEIADLSFPNPNFYALAMAMQHHYWLVAARGVGDGHPLERNMRVDARVLDAALQAILERGASLAP